MKNKKLKTFLNGLLFENPTLVIFLGMCPALGTTGKIESALYMSLCVLAVLICSNVIISLFRKIIPNEIRIPVYIIIIATLVTVVDMVFHAYLSYDIYKELGSFISLIVVNCIILGRAEAFASKEENSTLDSLVDALGYSCGFAAAILVVAFFRELLGTGCLQWAGNSVRIIPQDYVINFFQSNAGAFVTLGLLVALFTAIMNSVNAKKKEKEKAKLAAEKAAKAAQAAQTAQVAASTEGGK